MFEEIKLLKDYEGEVMLLEDDYYLSEDIIFTTHMLRGLRERSVLGFLDNARILFMCFG